MCGIWGYSGNDFNKYKFNILGLFNDSRGGDSCGTFLKTGKHIQITYGADKTKLYSSLVASGIHLELDNPEIALGHARKASVGGIGLAQAQPVIIKTDEGKALFAMIHNGTLVNYKELANKYGIEFDPKETDSQVFARVVFRAGYKVLEEYDGAGAFIFWDRRDGGDSIKVFKGASLYYEDDETIYVERPLYKMTSKNSFWFSSMEESLKFINDEDYDIEEIDCNTLYTYKNGKLISEVEYDRSTRQQSIKLAWNPKKSKTTYYSGYRNYYDGYDSYYNDYWEANGRFNSQKELPENSKNDSDKYHISTILTDKIENPGSYKNKIMYSEEGIYILNGEPCNGTIKASTAGYIDVFTQSKNYYFVAGVLMKSYFHYLAAIEYCKNTFGENYKEDALPYYLARYSATPVMLMYQDEANGDISASFYEWDDSLGVEVEVDGIFSPYFQFNRVDYKCKGGEIVEMSKYSNKHEFVVDKSLTALDEKILNKTIDLDYLVELIREENK